MARNSGNRPVGGQALTVGVRVLVCRNTEADVTGVVVEDYAAVTGPGGGGHEWAPVHRWAIVLDDGRLIFADTEDLTIDPSTHRSAQAQAQAQAQDPDPAIRISGGPRRQRTSPGLRMARCRASPAVRSPEAPEVPGCIDDR